MRREQSNAGGTQDDPFGHISQVLNNDGTGHFADVSAETISGEPFADVAPCPTRRPLLTVLSPVCSWQRPCCSDAAGRQQMPSRNDAAMIRGVVAP